MGSECITLKVVDFANTVAVERKGSDLLAFDAVICTEMSWRSNALRSWIVRMLLDQLKST